MVAKLCSRSHGQPVPGVRSAAMMSMSRAMSWDAVMGSNLQGGYGRSLGARRATAGHKLRRLAAPCPAPPARENADGRGQGPAIHNNKGGEGLLNRHTSPSVAAALSLAACLE